MPFDQGVQDVGGVPEITIDAKLNGVDDGRLFFFVQDKLINGNFKGTFTDPLMFEPSSP